MSQDFIERRRFPRVPVTQALTASLPTAVSVQLLDISRSGVLFASPQRIEPGCRAQLRTRIGAEPLAVQIEVKRIADSLTEPAADGCRVGAQFVALDADSRRKIERLVKTED